MLFKKIETRGLAHYSYLIGDENEAVVIDPRRDVDVYLDAAKEAGCNIIAVLETHRNEDYLIGSLEIKRKTGAEIWHADAQLDYQYGKPIEAGQIIEVGNLELEAIHTPGHTPGAFSYLLKSYQGEAWMIFSGDTLFAGDVGRVDFLGKEKLEEMSAKLYDSIFKKILPLGDEVILCPAHGSGSVCGSEIAQRELTTLGLEKKLNPKLQYESKEEFIANTAEILEYPPYFAKMEELNLTGGIPLFKRKEIKSLAVDKFSKLAQKEDSVIIDLRSELSFGASHIPGAISIWEDNLASFAGWFIDEESQILIINDGSFPREAVNDLLRLGFSNIAGYLKGGMLSWHRSAEDTEAIDLVKVKELCSIIDGSNNYCLLDIRSESELDKEGEIKEAVNIHVTQLLDNLEKLPKDKEIYIFCGSGIRSMMTASLLKNNGFELLNVVVGGLEGWTSTTCPIK